MSSPEEMFECTADAVFGTNKQMQILFWNKVCESLFNIKKDQAIGRHCYELVCGKDLLGNETCNQDCQITKHHDSSSPNQNFDLVIGRKGGEKSVVNVGSYYTNAVSSDSETPIHVFHSIRVVHCYQLIRRLSFNLGTAAEPDNNINRLSKREYEILKLISSGEKTRDIAQQLGISPTTVRNHTKNIYSKLEVHSKAEAINHAMRNGLV